MSTYDKAVDAEFCKGRKDPFAERVLVRFNRGMRGIGHDVLVIDTPTKAHALRSAVNEAVDLYLCNDRKGL